MTERFMLRFVLAGSLPTLGELRELWESSYRLNHHDDGVVVLSGDLGKLVTVDMLKADDARGRSLLAALGAQVAGVEGDDADTVRFVLDSAAAVIVASPEPDVDVEQALEPLNALWEYLFEEHGGLLQIDHEGFYGEEGLLVSVP
ncbi:MAG: hypothetical protein ACI9MC_003451 [Kiritimatiellia bacterium]|jgi:hypothetical protein